MSPHVSWDNGEGIHHSMKGLPSSLDKVKVRRTVLMNRSLGHLPPGMYPQKTKRGIRTCSITQDCQFNVNTTRLSEKCKLLKLSSLLIVPGTWLREFILDNLLPYLTPSGKFEVILPN